MFEAKILEGNILKKIVEAIKDVVNDVNIDVSPSGKHKALANSLLFWADLAAQGLLQNGELRAFKIQSGFNSQIVSLFRHFPASYGLISCSTCFPESEHGGIRDIPC